MKLVFIYLDKYINIYIVFQIRMILIMKLKKSNYYLGRMPQMM